MDLSEVPVDDTVMILEITDMPYIYVQRLVELGFIRGAKIRPVLTGILRGIRAYRIKNTTIALRTDTAKKIKVSYF